MRDEKCGQLNASYHHSKADHYERNWNLPSLNIAILTFKHMLLSHDCISLCILATACFYLENIVGCLLVSISIRINKTN